MQQPTARNVTDPPPIQGGPVSGSVFKRLLLAALGVLCVGIGAIGVFLPGIPTVGPLIVASLLFAKSIPSLEQKLIRNRLFARFLPYVDGNQPMPLRAKLITIGIMWTSILISIAVYSFSGIAPRWLAPLLVIAGAAGTWFIMRIGRKSKSDSVA
ncbi:MAG: YbaN family protein [Planctomycetota bacterium]